MPRTRGAAGKRSDAHRQRGEHDNQTAKTATGERRALAHATAESTTDSLQLFINQAAATWATGSTSAISSRRRCWG